MTRENAVVAIYHTHTDAEAAMREGAEGRVQHEEAVRGCGKTTTLKST